MLAGDIYLNFSLILMLCLPDVRIGTFALVLICGIGGSCYSTSTHSDLNLSKIAVIVFD